MNLRQLEIFRAVMQAGSTKNAAHLLLISQPAVSNMIRQFEDQLGFPLFERKGGRLRPTPEAETLYANSDTLFTHFDAVRNLAEDLRDTQAGTLKFVASPSIGQTIIPKAIAAFVHDRPAVKVGFDTPPHEHVIDLLVGDQADFGLTITPIDHPALETSSVRKGKLVCVLPKGHALAGRTAVRPRDLREEHLISYPRASPIGLVVDEAFREAGEHQHINMNVRFCFTACTLVDAGAGVAIVDEFTVSEQSFKNLIVKPFKSNQDVAVSLSYSRLRPLSRLATIFLEDYLWQSGTLGQADLSTR
ncbi:MAG: LysR family transcriptional regulator [Methyloligellaceae bacterium]